MFCNKCGTKNADEARFCISCGNNLGEKVENEKLPSSESNQKKKGEFALQASLDKLTRVLKVFPRKVLIGIGVFLVALIALVLLLVNQGRTIDLNDYLVIEENGYNGYGSLSARIDWSAIEEKYGNKVSFRKEAKNEYGEFFDLITPVNIVQDSVDVNLDKKEKLKNGDKVQYTFDIDEELYSYVRCKLKYKDESYTVSSLTSLETFDAFADLEVVFSGIAPYGVMEMNYIGSDLNYYNFSPDKWSELSNGDSVIISIDDSIINQYAENYGKIPIELEKEYKVQGLSTLLLKASDIKSEDLQTMQKQASDEFNSYVARSWGESASLQSFTYIGNYLLSAKDNSDNYFVLVYKAQSRTLYSNYSKTYDELIDIYWYVTYDNLVLNENGDLLFDSAEYETPKRNFKIDSGISAGWFSTFAWYFDGYQTLSDLYKDVVTKNIDLYNCEDNIDESLAPAQ